MTGVIDIAFVSFAIYVPRSHADFYYYIILLLYYFDFLMLSDNVE